MKFTRCVWCSALGVVVLLATATTHAGAQLVRAAGPADSVRVWRVIFDRLFDGIALTPEAEANARRVIRDTDVKQAALLPITEDAGWGELIALQDRRDSVLKAMLASDADRSRFERNAAPMRPRSRARRPAAPPP
jgi:hypothetical protein